MFFLGNSMIAKHSTSTIIVLVLCACAQHAGAGEENARSGIASNSAVRTWDESHLSGRRRIAVAEANHAYPEKAAKHRYTLYSCALCCV
jgi:hypothetical protein